MTLTVTSKPLYLGLLAIVLTNITLLVTSRATLDLSNLHMTLQWTLAFGLLFFCVSRMHGPKGRVLISFKHFCEAMFFSTLVSLNLPMLNHLTMMIPFPYQDDLLNGMDVALGINWLGYFDWVHGQPALIGAMEWSYDQLTLVGLAVMTSLIIMGDARRVRFYMEIFFFTAVFCIVVGAAFPALAAVHMYIDDLSVYANFPNPPGVYHLPYMEMLRDPAQAVSIDPVGLAGLVTFPSYHTASGILLCVAVWRTWLILPVAAYSAVMIASAPIFGGHYIIDLIAGTVVALGISWIIARRPYYAGLFARGEAKPDAAPQMA